ncbi:pyruvate dehydrogenase (acetyl-transferring) E1 component subunit alpha [Candidatus Woesearchaeota archaeon]|nr:pyruvate dehydrogenase (acetyl-transferring) E1 component subunit alpha [Candidatus Woesearchaeota archaeon]
MDGSVCLNFSRIQILKEDGSCDASLLPKLQDADVKKLYEWMVFSKVFDEIAIKLQREGRMGTYAPMRGEEASIIGSAYALKNSDWLAPSFRENGALIMRGHPVEKNLLYWMGDERGAITPNNVNNLPVSIPVATHALHAVGLAWGAKLKGDKVAVMAYFGDGATSEGDFHEALNFAGAFKAPVVFVCLNNQWAISVPREKQTASKTLAQKALAYGFDGIQVDGNDVFAVYKTAKEALDKARSGGGPTLIECYTYRIGDHTTSDDASRYRDKKEVEEWAKKDPIDRLERYMKKKSVWNETYRDTVRKDAEKKILEGVKKAESTPPQKPTAIFEHVYAEIPETLKEQMKDFEGSEQ